MHKFKAIDLFAGIGGIRRGFELTGFFESVLSAEIDKFACKTYEHLFGENPYNDVTSEEFKNKVSETNYDILLGGFPCQAFSIAGKKEGFRDKTRGTLFFDVADILDRTRPKAFVLENVEGLLRHKKGQTFHTVLETLVLDLNYKVIGVEKNSTHDGILYDPRSFLINSRFFGIPQNRPRVYIVGFNQDHYGDFLESIALNELPKKRDKKPIYADLNELLEFPASPEYFLASGYLATLKKHRDRHKEKGNGYGYIIVNDKGVTDPTSNAILATGGSGKERNLVYDPYAIVAGLQVRGKKTPLNDQGIRFMTPREWGKLQGFINYAFINEHGKDTFSFPDGISRAQQYKQFGNSVTIPVIEVIAEEVGKTMIQLEKEMYRGKQISLEFNQAFREVAVTAK